MDSESRCNDLGKCLGHLEDLKRSLSACQGVENPDERTLQEIESYKKRISDWEAFIIKLEAPEEDEEEDEGGSMPLPARFLQGWID